MNQVQIIGWLYQYYNSELKDIVMKKKNYTKDDIPAATQLFTPDWIVRYMVENSLGRLYINKKKHEGIFEDGRDPSEMIIDEINDKRIANEKYISNEMGWKYYLPEAKQDVEVLKELEKIELEHSILQPEDIKLIDPCMGSGHILVYAFDVLMDIYRDAGYSDRDASKSILENNLYGLEIDERAYHLAYFALMMKARQYNRRILSKDTKINLVEIVESSPELNDDLLSHLGEYKELGQYLVETFKEAKEFGSILNLDCTLEQLQKLENNLFEIENNAKYGSMLDQIESQQLIDLIDPLLKQAKLLVQKYDVVVTNPPYMPPSPKQKQYVQKNYPDSKSDLFAVFIEKCHDLTKKNAYQAMITMHSWMFLSSFEKLRNKLISNNNIVNMAHLGARAFEEIGGEVVQTTSFIIENNHIKNYQSGFKRLVDYNSQDGKKDEYLTERNLYVSSSENFNKIPGSPIAYWVSDLFLDSYKNKKLEDIKCYARNGITTGENDLFIRLWFEVVNINNKWYPLNKGGAYRKWYGNLFYIIDWENDGYRIKHLFDKNGKMRATLRSIDYKFEEAITMTRICSGLTSFRFLPEGFITEGASNNIYFKDSSYDYFALLGFLNSKTCEFILKMTNPTINVMPENLKSLPIVVPKNISNVKSLVISNINVAKIDWNYFEISWDFKTHPLVELRLAGASAWGNDSPSARISSAYKAWSIVCEESFNQLKANEEELNRIFIDIYGLQDELIPEVEDKDVTVRKADLVRDIKSFISYAVGCMFGRYSLDIEGLAYAGGEWDSSKYSTFIPDADDIIPICDEEYFEDDIVSRFIEFVSVVYGSDTLEENLKFIADALGSKGTPREVLRNYFLNDFYKDHCNTYQVTGSGKRPIYWLFDSGKKNGFKALVYIHRYTPDLIARMRTGYIHPQQARYRTQIELLQEQIDMAGSTSEKVKLSKQLKKINEQLLELNKYEEIVHHWADKMEPMDLDDGVKVNYAKFQELLAKIK